MKTVFTFTILFLTTVLFGQNSDFETPDSLSIVKLDYKILDSTAIKATTPHRYFGLKNIRTFDNKEGNFFAYYTTDKNKWTIFPLPFSELFNVYNTIALDSVNFINLDNLRQQEIIIIVRLGNYGSGGGDGKKGMAIINTDSIPTQIFKIFFSCYDESFGNTHTNGEGAYFNEYKRKINIADNKIIISPLDKKQYPYADCTLTAIPSGTYFIDNGQIKKKNNR